MSEFITDPTDIPTPRVDDTVIPTLLETYRLVFQLNEAMCAYNRSMYWAEIGSGHTEYDTHGHVIHSRRFVNVSDVDNARRELQSAVTKLRRAVPVPPIPPVFVVGHNMPGYSPDGDSAHAFHVDISNKDDIDNACDIFIDEIVRGVESSIEALLYDRDTRTESGNDPDVYVFALSDTELSDAINGDESFLESLQSTKGDSVGVDIRTGIRAALITGTEYGYGVNLGNDTSENYFIVPCEDIPEPGACTCSEYTDNGHGCEYVPSQHPYATNGN